MSESRFADLPVLEGASLAVWRAAVVGASLVIASVSFVTVQDLVHRFPFWTERWGSDAAIWLTVAVGIYAAFWAYLVSLVARAWNPNTLKRYAERLQPKQHTRTMVALMAGVYASWCFVQLTGRQPSLAMLVMPLAMPVASTGIRRLARRPGWSSLRLIEILFVLVVLGLFLYRASYAR